MLFQYNLKLDGGFGSMSHVISRQMWTVLCHRQAMTAILLMWNKPGVRRQGTEGSLIVPRASSGAGVIVAVALSQVVDTAGSGLTDCEPG